MDVTKKRSRRIGIVGYGQLGQFLVNQVKAHPELELGFVWNRTQSKLHKLLDDSQILLDLNDFSKRNCDLIVEVAHPNISFAYGQMFLEHCDILLGSPSALANSELTEKLRNSANHNGIYIPSGAFWGGEDIKKMADQGTLKELKVTMTKHPTSLKLEGELQEKCNKVTTKAQILYDGPVRNLCPLAPNNVNTMATAAIAAHNLGFDGVHGCLVADPDSLNWHTIDIEVTGGGDINGRNFTVKTTRRNPANTGAVTGTATYGAFFSSLLGARGKGPGIHLC